MTMRALVALAMLASSYAWLPSAAVVRQRSTVLRAEEKPWEPPTGDWQDDAAKLGSTPSWLSADGFEAGLDEGILSFSRPHSRLYGESL